MSFIRRSTLTAALVSSLALASFAQTTPAPTPTTTPAPLTSPLLPPLQVTTEKYKDYLTKRYADDKEARAVIHLYSRKKTGGAIWLATGAGVIGLVASQTGTKSNGSGGTSTVTVTPLGYGLLLGIFGGIGIGKLARFGNEKLYRVLADYDQSHAFPGFVMEHLADKDYQ
ncbi:hypothetical protein [Hymenobacter chitinivorans]|uniref:Uncharacterized protein n=1 Tax=Hymenobacter chitinivorans DSM 11115 TaxID=1121954 RepID=A0A2M9BSX3_9BACT|nr:hypothetical protein [Hymenobacter chitinivorans]PJJ61033.1 hypothetical protein CLV45_2470 [Hymenobacter chitinivorans DSM 11115]